MFHRLIRWVRFWLCWHRDVEMTVWLHDSGRWIKRCRHCGAMCFRQPVGHFVFESPWKLTETAE